ncbi:Oxysterol-binding protein-domain-containing protein [Mycena sp. CBHHK59/15]|nr:Oxysterol-binding protein-domain-containing protein [Mycena sp. CBHHK59/15]
MASSTSSSSIKKSTTPSSSINASAGDTTAPAEPLYQVKLLSALRSGDPALIHPFLAEIGKEKRKSADQRGSSASSVTNNSSNASNSAALDTGAAALHLAIRCTSRAGDGGAAALAPRDLAERRPPAGVGTTALHLASALGRADIVNLLLDQESVDDTLRDREGRSARDVARGKDVVRVIDDSRALLNASYRSVLRSYILSPLPMPSAPPQSPPELLALLSSPRVAHIDLAYLDDASGSALLHEAARRRDLRLIELAVRAGADVFARDKRGKLPGGVGRTRSDEPRREPDPGVRGRGAGAARAAGLPEQIHECREGIQSAVVRTQGGVLSYYRHREDEQFASRGSIAVRTCVLKAPSGTDRMRFEIHSGHRGGGVTTQKWYVKANHPVEASRWVQAIEASIAWGKAREGDAADEREREGVISSGASISSRQRLVSVLRKGGGSISMRRNGTGGSEADSMVSEYAADRESGEGSPRIGGESDADAEPREEEQDADAEEEDDDEEGYDDSSANSASLRTKFDVPHEATFDLLGNSLAAQMELMLALVGDTGAARDALKDALGMVNEYVAISRERDAWWRRRLARAKVNHSAWAESLASAVREGEALERELRTRSRKRGSRFFDADQASTALAGVGANGTLKARGKRPSMLASSALVEDSPVASPLEMSPPALATVPSSAVDTQVAACPPAVTTATANSTASAARSQTADTLVPATATASFFTARSYMNHGDTESVIDTDEEDEFFDAIEANTIPNLVVHEALKSPTHSELALPENINVEPYAGYQHLREELLLNDARPSTSLWSVLKHSIGKDLTKISFPVFFNEPTSMLQRMAEDMEFSECLDVAAKERDAHQRLAFVAAFAMSNYSSTIGRIAKPFNPMLSETFEYVRIDKEYRYLSEQVSHHPPISACMAESPYWRYFGEVDAQNKFMGKSFEIRPTGVAHTELLLPAEFAPNYPKAGAPFEGKVREHYSWKKVTTNVSGFILGSPTIDHYGDMVITNHRTQDTCILTFKPRGWRGKDAYEISGRVMHASGQVSYEISGRWNSQLIARHVGAGSGTLIPDLSVSSLSSPSATPEYILLWRNSEKPEGSPFNLTPFAITLNDCPKDTLKPYVCPTDCRLRPDQRAFEMGKYEIANTLKNDQEEKQRATRKAREQGDLPPHKPRWFSAQTDGDTGERVWAPARREDGVMEYWAERERVWKLGGNQPWADVNPIFIDEPDFVR